MEGYAEEKTTDGMSGKDNAKKKIDGTYPHTQDGYMKSQGPGSTSLQDESMNKAMQTKKERPEEK